MNARELQRIAIQTIDQENEMWFAERRKRVTASNFGLVCKMRASTNRKGKVFNALYKTKSTSSKALVYGKMMESVARDAYTNYTRNTVIQHGLVISDKYPFLGCSPDGIIINKANKKWMGLIEIKCPYSHKDFNQKQFYVDKPLYLEERNDVLLNSILGTNCQSLLHLQ